MVPPKGVYLPISKLHSILTIKNLLAHNNISQISYCGQISIQSAAVNWCFSVTTLGVTFLLLAMLRKFCIWFPITICETSVGQLLLSRTSYNFELFPTSNCKDPQAYRVYLRLYLENRRETDFRTYRVKKTFSNNP